jgi:hypothetical protein
MDIHLACFKELLKTALHRLDGNELTVRRPVSPNNHIASGKTEHNVRPPPHRRYLLPNEGLK